MQKYTTIILIFLTLSVSHAQNSEDFLQVKREPDNSIIVSIAAKKRSILQIVTNIAKSLGLKVVAKDQLLLRLNEKYVTIFLKKRSLSKVLEYVTGILGCSFYVKDGQIVIYEVTGKDHIARTITGYKRLLITSKDKKKQALVYFSLGTSLYFHNKPKLAFIEFNNLFQQFPKSKILPEALLMMAKCLIKAKQYREAKKVLTTFFNQFSKSKFRNYAFLMLAKCNEKQFLYNDAIRIYEYLISAKVQNVEEVLYKKGLAYFRTGNYSRARDTFSELYGKLDKKSPMITKVLHKLVKTLVKLSMEPEAVEAINTFYSHTDKNDPLYEKVLLEHGRLTFKNQKYMETIYLLKTVLESKNKDILVEALNITASCYEKLGLEEMAVTMLEKHSMKISPDDTRIYPLLYNVGKLYQKLRRWSSARIAFQRIVGKYNDKVYLKIIECDYYSQDYDGCIDTFSDYVEKIQDSIVLSRAFHFAGKSYMHLGKIDKAEEIFHGKWKK